MLPRERLLPGCLKSNVTRGSYSRNYLSVTNNGAICRVSGRSSRFLRFSRNSEALRSSRGGDRYPSGTVGTSPTLMALSSMATTFHCGVMVGPSSVHHAVTRSAASELKPDSVAVLSTPKTSCRAFYAAIDTLAVAACEADCRETPRGASFADGGKERALFLRDFLRTKP